MARFSTKAPSFSRQVGKLQKAPKRNTYGPMQIGNHHVDLEKVNLEREIYGLPHLSRTDARRKAEGFKGEHSLHKHLAERPAHLGEPNLDKVAGLPHASTVTPSPFPTTLHRPLAPIPHED